MKRLPDIEERSDKLPELPVDQSYVIHVPPGWLLAGRVAKVNDEYITFTDTVYIENVAAGHSPLALLEVKDLSSWTTPYWIGDVQIRRDAILLAVAIPKGLSTRQFAPQMKALDKAKR